MLRNTGICKNPVPLFYQYICESSRREKGENLERTENSSPIKQGKSPTEATTLVTLSKAERYSV